MIEYNIPFDLFTKMYSISNLKLKIKKDFIDSSIRNFIDNKLEYITYIFE
jgi:hypothetical protein